MFKSYILLLLILVILSNYGLGLEIIDVGVKIIIKSVDVDLFLNTDGSVDSSVISKGVSAFKFESEKGAILSSMIISDDELIDQQSIEIVDLHNPSIKFIPTTNLDPESCLNKYIFNEINNDLHFCVRPTKEDDLYYKIKYKYEAIDYPEFDACKNIGIIRRPINFAYLPQKESYSASYSLSADKDILLNVSQVCDLGWVKTYLDNGFKCINKNLTFPNDSVVLILNATLRGIKKSYIEQEEEKEKIKEQNKLIEEQSRLNNKLKIKNAVDKILLIIIGMIGFVPKISKKFKIWLGHMYENNRYRLMIIVLVVILLYFIFQTW